MLEKMRDPFQHLIDDYRDPVPRKLPPVKKFKMKEKQDVDSVLNIKSDDCVWDGLRELKLLKRNQHTNYHSLRNRQRDILLNIPLLSDKERRRRLMPAFHWVPFELMEDNKLFACFIMNYLFNEHDRLLSHLPDKLRDEKHLRNSPKTIKILGTILSELNIHLEKGEMEKFITLLLRSGYYFEEEGENSWWLAQEFYNFAKEMTDGIDDDYVYSSAVINCIFGKFLLLKANDPQKAIRCFSKAIPLSKNKGWGVEWLTGVEEETIFKCSTRMCYLALLEAAELLYYDNPMKAMILSEDAMKMASECKWDKEYKEAQIEYIIYALHANKLSEAKSQLLNLKEEVNIKYDINIYVCVMLLWAEYYVRVQRIDDALKKLLKLIAKANKHQVTWLRALTYKFIGQIFLSQDNAVKALKYLKGATRLYHMIADEDELAQCEYLLGIALDHINQNN